MKFHKSTPLTALFLSSLLATACSPANQEEAPVLEPVTDTAKESPLQSAEPAETTATYKDGTYTQLAEYRSPAGLEEIEVSLTLKDGVVEGVKVLPLASNETSLKFQTGFSENVVNLVQGASLDDIEKLGAVSGSSLTPKAFNAAVEAIKAEAAVSA